MAETPTFAIGPIGGATVLAVAEEALTQAVVSDYFDPIDDYQSAFGVYERMPLTSSRRSFTYLNLTSDYLLWQKLKPCTWDPTNNFASSSRTITPAEVELMEQICLPTAADGFFNVFRDYDNEGAEFDPAVVRAAVNLIGRAAVSGAKLQFAVGNKYGAETASTDDARVASNFEKTKDAVTGWLTGVEGDTGLNRVGLITAVNYADGFTGDPLDLFDSMMNSSSRELQRAVMAGQFGSGRRVVFMVTDDIFYQFRQAHLDEKASVATNGVRIAKESFGNGRPYYTIDDAVVVVQATDFTGYDSIVNKRTTAAVLTVAGNIQYGFNYDRLTTALATDVVPGMIVEQHLVGQYKDQLLVRSTALMATGIASTELMTAAVVTTDGPTA